MGVHARPSARPRLVSAIFAAKSPPSSTGGTISTETRLFEGAGSLALNQGVTRKKPFEDVTIVSIGKSAGFAFD